MNSSSDEKKTDLKNRWIAPVSLNRTNIHIKSAKQFITNFKETFPSLKKRTKKILQFGEMEKPKEN